MANLGDSRAVASVGGTVKQLTQALELAQINILQVFRKKFQQNLDDGVNFAKVDKCCGHFELLQEFEKI